MQKKLLPSVLLTWFFAASPLEADVVYRFEGINTNADVIDGVLRLDNAYTPGDPLDEGSATGGGFFLSFTWSVNGVGVIPILPLDNPSSYILLSDATGAGGGTLPSILGVAKVADVLITDPTSTVGLTNGYGGLGIGEWRIDDGTGIPFDGFSEGADGMWTLNDAGDPVPEPPSLTLLLGSLGVLGIGIRRRR